MRSEPACRHQAQRLVLVHTVHIICNGDNGYCTYLTCGAANFSHLPLSRFVKIAVISDIHANLEALSTALKAIGDWGIKEIFCLGDVVGYGPDPAACIDLVRASCTAVVRGNHDDAVATGKGFQMLPRDGQEAALHNHKQLSAEQRAYLDNLPLITTAHESTFVHATPDQPHFWKRIDSYTLAQEQFSHFDTSICFTGHTHIPAVMSDRLGVLRVRKGNRYLINVGSIGQPRDHNPRLSFGVFDTDTYSYELIRLPYNIDRTVSRILEAGLPSRLAARLQGGW